MDLSGVVHITFHHRQVTRTRDGSLCHSWLLITLEIQINITKSFLLEVFFGLDDSKKSLLILLITDLLVGYHSSNLWELFFEFIWFSLGNVDFRLDFVWSTFGAKDFLAGEGRETWTAEMKAIELVRHRRENEWRSNVSHMLLITIIDLQLNFH